MKSVNSITNQENYVKIIYFTWTHLCLAESYPNSFTCVNMLLPNHFLSDVKGKCVVVTDGTNGIGYAIVSLLLTSEARVRTFCHSTLEASSYKNSFFTSVPNWNLIVTARDNYNLACMSETFKIAHQELGGMDILIDTGNVNPIWDENTGMPCYRLVFGLHKFADLENKRADNLINTEVFEMSVMPIAAPDKKSEKKCCRTKQLIDNCTMQLSNELSKFGIQNHNTYALGDFRVSNDHRNIATAIIFGAARHHCDLLTVKLTVCQPKHLSHD